MGAVNDDNPVYAVGPGSRVRSRGPVEAAYAETDALTRPCPECHVAAGAFCVHADGSLRKCFCPNRLKGNNDD